MMPVFQSVRMEEPVGVLCGGPSAEREISIRSGTAVAQALRESGVRAERIVLSEDPARIREEIRAARIGCAFVALHGTFGEDGQVQAILEGLGIPYTGSSAEASRLGIDKGITLRRWAEAGLPVPEWTLVRQGDPVPSQARRRFPLVIKPAAQGSSVGMSIADQPEDLPRALAAAFRYGHEALLEEFLPGDEMTVGILEDEPLPVVQIIPKRRFYDYVAKYTPGMTEYLVPAPIPEEESRRLQALAREAHRALGCRSYSRVDLISVPGRGPVLLEINTIPGMTETSLLPKAAAAVGIGFPELCLRMLASTVVQKGVS